MPWLIIALLLCSVSTSVEATDLQLTYSAQINRQDDLYLVEVGSGKVHRITEHRAKDSHGIPSPDGAQIVFSSERVGWWKVWLAKADGTKARQLTNPPTGADYHPDWSPDGKRIVYVRGALGNGDIMVMNADGTEAINISQHEGKDNFPAWSPDGRWIAFASDRDGIWSIYVTNPEGSEVRRVSEGREAIEPSWYPDSRRLAYQAIVDDSFDLFTVSLDGSTSPRQLTETKDNEKRPAISPDGDWIAFESDRDGGSHIYILPVKGGQARRMTHRGYNYGPHWWPMAVDLENE